MYDVFLTGYCLYFKFNLSNYLQTKIMSQFKINESKHLTKVQDKIKSETTSGLSQIVIDNEVETEKARVTAFARIAGAATVAKLKELEITIKKEDKPDVKQHVRNGEVFTAQDSYSNGQFQKVSQLYTDHKRLTDAFDKAMESGKLVDFEELDKVLKQIK